MTPVLAGTMPNPVEAVANGITGLVGRGVSSVGGSVLDAVGDAIARGLATACRKVSDELLGFLATGTGPNFDAGWWAGDRGQRILASVRPWPPFSWHHHGNSHGVGHVLSGVVRLESGSGGGQVVESAQGQYLYLPRFAVHREANRGSDDVIIFVVRFGPDHIGRGRGPEAAGDRVLQRRSSRLQGARRILTPSIDTRSGGSPPNPTGDSHETHAPAHPPVLLCRWGDPAGPVVSV